MFVVIGQAPVTLGVEEYPKEKIKLPKVVRARRPSGLVVTFEYYY